MPKHPRIETLSASSA